ncbi:MAG: hypothetical protein WCT12_21285, partial [Verrucomicrobiota bacterium]
SLGANMVLDDTGGGTITFNSTIDGHFTLQVNTSGDEVFNGAVGRATPLVSLTTDGDGNVGGHAYLNVPGTSSNPSVSTSGAQVYNDNLSLGADTVLTAGSTAFNGGVTANGYTLTVNYPGLPNVTLLSLSEESNRRILETIMPQLRREHVNTKSFGGSLLSYPGYCLRSAQVPLDEDKNEK